MISKATLEAAARVAERATRNLLAACDRTLQARSVDSTESDACDAAIKSPPDVETPAGPPLED